MTKRRAFGHLRKLPSGRWQASYIGPDKHRRNAPITFRAKLDANQWLVREEASIIEGRWSESQPDDSQTASITFETFARRHIEIQTNATGNLLRVSTQSLYRRLLNLHLAEFFELTLQQITSARVSDWWARSLESGKTTTSAKSYKLLSSVLSRAVREGLIASNPCKVRGAHSANSGIKVIVPSSREIRRIADCINPRYKALILTLAYSGLRFGEATELRTSDIELDTKQPGQYWINVQRAVMYVDGVHIVGAPKSRASTRRIPVSSELAPVLEALLRQGSNAEVGKLLFPSASGAHLRHDVFTNEWKRALQRAEIPDRITPHSLRHFAGSALAQAGANLAELKAWLGDSSTSAVMRYIHDTGRTRNLVQSMQI